MSLQFLSTLATANYKQAFKACVIVVSLSLCNSLLAIASIHPAVSIKRDVVIAPDAAGILYVNKANATSGTGSSWNDAITEFADALKAAGEINAVTAGAVKEIWISGGTYKPLYMAGNGTSDRNKSFVLVKDVKIYGGFAGTEATLTARDLNLTAHATTLSGDLNGDDAADFTNYSDNAHHVIIAVRNIGTALLDGLTISGGNADNSSSITVNGSSITSFSGGGIICIGSALQLNQVNICRNYGSNGGAIFGYGAGSGLPASITMNTGKISENKANTAALLTNRDLSTSSFTNVLISDNLSTGSDLLVSNNSRSGGNIVFTNVTIAGNKSDNSSGRLIASLLGSEVVFHFRNCIILYNTKNNSATPSGIDGLGAVNYSSISNSLVQGLSSTANNNINGIGVNAQDVFKDPAAGNFKLKAGGIVINKGRNDVINLTTDLAGKPRVFNDIVDLGAYEWHKEILEMSFSNVEDDKLLATYGDADFWPLTSALAVTLTVPDANGKAAIIDNKIHILEVGEVLVTLNFAGDATYEPLTISKTLLIKKGTQTITFPVLGTKETTAADFELLASTNSNLSLSYTSSNTSVAEVYQDALDGNKWKIKIKGIGDADITAIQTGNINYLSASFLRTLRVVEPTLPVTLSNYQAKLEANKVKLTWTTQSEQNNRAFIISHSTDGKNFKVLTEVQGKGSGSNVNSYQYEHLSPLAGANYYQLTQVDFNGDTKELGIKTIDFELVNEIQLYPNPVVEKVTVAFSTGYHTIELINGNGSVLQRINIANTDVSKEISLANYPPAIYFIKLSGPNKTDIHKLIKHQ